MYHRVPIYQFPYITAANSYIGHPGCPKLYGHPGAHVVAAGPCKATLESFPIVILHHATICSCWLADHNITQSNIRVIIWNPSSNADHQAETNGVKTSQEIPHHLCCRGIAISTMRQAGNNHIVLSNPPQGIGVMIVG